jgi:hypothetical protein
MAMKTPDIFDLYTDYLITSFSHTTATGLSGYFFCAAISIKAVKFEATILA